MSAVWKEEEAMNKRLGSMKHDLKPTYVLCKQYTPGNLGDRCLCGRPYLSHESVITPLKGDWKKIIYGKYFPKVIAFILWMIGSTIFVLNGQGVLVWGLVFFFLSIYISDHEVV